nr:endothelin-converting enzyme 1-like [Rhipicephalus microplus]
MGVDKPSKTFFSEQPRCDQTFKMNDDNNVVYLNLRSVLFFLGCITAIIICSVTLFNIVASRFWTPGSLELDTPPSAVQAPSSSPVYYAPVSSVASPSRVPTVIPRKKGTPKRSAKTHKKHKKHKKRPHSRRRSPHSHRSKKHNGDGVDASEENLGAMQARQDAPDSAFVNNYDSWKEIADDGSGERRRRNECGKPQCRWLSRYLTSKLDWTIKPCHDFYSHVCSAKWFASSTQETTESERDRQGSLDFRTQAVARLMNELTAYLRNKASAMPWERNAAAFFSDCVNPKNPRTLSSIRPRFPIWPLEKITSVSTLPKLVAYVAKFFRSTPLLKAYVGELRSTLRNDTLYVDSPVLPLARFQYLYPTAKEEDYKKVIRAALQGRRAGALPQAIVKLELALARIVSRDFVTLADRTVETENLRTGDEFWDPLMMALVGNRREVHALDHKYLMNLMSVLRNATSPLDVANLIIYSTLTQIAPLIQNMSFLIPLGLEQTVTGVPLQVQGCLSLTEKSYRHGMRLLALKVLGVTEWSPEKPKARVIQNLIADLKKALKKYVRAWFTETDSRRDALKRIRTLKVDLLGATPHDELTYARNEKYFGKPRQVAALLEDVPSRDFNYGGDFFPGSAFSTEPKYMAETHTLYLPPAMFGLIDKMQEFDDPLLMVPLIGAPVLKAMLAVIDGRGTQTFLRDSSVSTHWWSPADDSKLTKIRSCYRDLYALSLKDMLINSNYQTFFEEFIAQGALLDPLQRFYKEKVSKYYPDGLRIEPEFTADMLFYIVYTMGMCEPHGSERYKVKHRMGIPARILVNAHLGSSDRFRRAFKCKHSDEMMPLHSCSYWDEH